MISVVLVDDDPAILTMLNGFIPWETYDMKILASFTSSIEAFAYLQNHAVQLVFTDLIMPQMDGIQLIQKAVVETPSTIFIALSSHDDFKLVKNAFLQGATDYILKEDLDSPVFGAFLKKIQERCEIEYHHPSSNEIKIQNSMKYMSGINPADRFSITLLASPYLEVKDVLESNGKKEQLRSNLLMVDLEKITCIIHKSRYVENSSPWFMHLRKQHALENTAVSYCPNGTKNEISKLYYKAAEQMADQQFFEQMGFPAGEIQTGQPVKDLMSAECLTAVKAGAMVMDIKKINAALLTLSKGLAERLIGRKVYLAKIAYAIQYFYDCFSYIDFLISCLLQKEQIEQELQACLNVTQVNKWIILSCKNFEVQLMTSQNEQLKLMVRAYLEHNFSQPLTLKEIAELFHVSEGHLSRSFYQANKIHIKEYLNFIRIEKAKMLLATTQLTIHDISESVGYQNVEHFFRTFKKMVGIPPNHYRNL